MSGISTHILDLTTGRPAAGVRVFCFRESGGQTHVVAEKDTDQDGRIRELLPGDLLQPADYRLRFETGSWFAARGLHALHPFVEVVVRVRSSAEHYHVPLLVTPYSYSTYRGS